MKKKIYRKVEEVEEGRKESNGEDQKLFQLFNLLFDCEPQVRFNCEPLVRFNCEPLVRFDLFDCEPQVRFDLFDFVVKNSSKT
jgi:hypothetical protein